MLGVVHHFDDFCGEVATSNFERSGGNHEVRQASQPISSKRLATFRQRDEFGQTLAMNRPCGSMISMAIAAQKTLQLPMSQSR